MIFNEILIPQDSFTETNVTRKRSIVGNSQLHSQHHFIQNFIFCFYIIFFAYFYMSLKNMKDNNKTTCHTKMMHKNKILKKGYQNNSYQIRIEMIVSLSQILFSANSIKQKELANNKQYK